MERTATAIRRHGNFVLMVRDERSYRLAREHFACDIHQCPDMAFYLGALPRACPPSHPLLLLMRTDREAASARASSPADTPSQAVTADWLDEPSGMKERIKA
ncbi:polysaccharide pyruvyl transferase family protein, partial [Salmonella enterica]|uniref:polysaccharide pyruvyl transferase family protein n=1 Tax=Salmonella enterica TaxID=28901 RepID=UPI003FA687C9